jgi:hypothetical protein
MKQVKQTELPQALQDELSAMITALTKKYGAAAVEVGTHIETLAGVVLMVSREMSADERAHAAKHAHMICGAAIRSLGEALNANPDHCFAVARSLQDYARHAADELEGEQPTTPELSEQAAAVIERAKATVH